MAEHSCVTGLTGNAGLRQQAADVLQRTLEMPSPADNPDHDGPGPFLPAVLAGKTRRTLAMVRLALQRKQVALALQPVVFANDPGRVAFCEGLIRVLDESGRVIPAADFIGLAEPTELGRQIDCAALGLALALDALRSDPGLRLAVNMSARTMGYVHWLETLADGLARDETVASDSGNYRSLGDGRAGNDRHMHAQAAAARYFVFAG